MMRRIPISVICSATAAVLGFSASTYCAIVARRVPLPEVQANPTVLDFGSVSQHQTLQATVRIENRGSHEVLIRDIKTSCSSTAVTTSDGPIAPSSAKEIAVEWQSGGRRGAVQDAVILFLDERAMRRRGMMTIPIVANVRSALQIAPDTLAFARGHAETQFIDVRPSGDTPVAVTAAFAESLALSTRVVNSGRVEVTFDPAHCPDDLHETTITLDIEGASEPRVFVPVSIH